MVFPHDGGAALATARRATQCARSCAILSVGSAWRYRAVNRRELIALLGGAAAAWPFATRAQQATKIQRIGSLRYGAAAANADRVEALRAGLRLLGYVEGTN